MFFGVGPSWQDVTFPRPHLDWPDFGPRTFCDVGSLQLQLTARITNHTGRAQYVSLAGFANVRVASLTSDGLPVHGRRTFFLPFMPTARVLRDDLRLVPDGATVSFAVDMCDRDPATDHKFEYVAYAPARFDVTFTYHYTGPDFDPPDGTPTFRGTLVSNEVTLNAK